MNYTDVEMRKTFKIAKSSAGHLYSQNKLSKNFLLLSSFVFHSNISEEEIKLLTKEKYIDETLKENIRNTKKLIIKKDFRIDSDILDKAEQLYQINFSKEQQKAFFSLFR